MVGHRMRWLVGALIVLVVCGSLRAAASDEASELPADLEPGWYARIVTSMGTILVELLPEQAPQSVAHFAAAAEGRLEWVDPVTGKTQKTPFYDGVLVHLAEAGKRFEAGDRRGTGQTPPPFYVADEGYGPVNFHGAGRLGMVRFPGGRISAIQFFVTASAMPWLSGSYPCFGKVVSDLEIVHRISQVKTYNNGRPIEPVVIESIRVFQVGEPDPLAELRAYFPKPVQEQLAPDRQRR